MAERNDKNRTRKADSVFFWDTARRFLDHELLKIRKKARIPLTRTVLRLTFTLVFWKK